ncbi:KAP family P-loop NTPase fold protein [Aliidiomarina sanyensis]|uniref:AAA family ATPase n=1 Tax=Aliidiomarina sanyensis TaxID=1249555 RepID=A0A432WBB5_9GAMM|nr:P-loop NTPase fold protein [Aliidiomarina sanyensis]RUO28756.1 AAA family ATPase [Aliidiomarina sanyensis]
MTELVEAMTFATRDEFQREPIADQLINLLTSEIEISPLVIDGDWGTGKTEFCTKLKHKLENQTDYRAVYVDAFKADHADNPLMTILSAVLSLVDKAEKQSLRDKALPVLRLGVKVAGKAFVSHLLRTDSETLQAEVARELDKAADEVIDSAVHSMLKDHEEAETNIKALQKTLEAVAKDHPIVIFIDELDRCRPDFAVEMLELIKHTFDVSGIQFVLVTNMKQLKAAINHAYGAGVEAERYLDKFIKFRCVLPENYRRTGDSYQRERRASVEYLVAALAKSKTLEGTRLATEQNKVTEFAKELVSRKSCSLREVETFVRHLEIYHQLTGGLNDRDPFGFALIRIFGVFVYCFHIELAGSIRARKLSEESIVKALGESFIEVTEVRKADSDTICTITGLILQDIEGTTSADEQSENKVSDVTRAKRDWFGIRGLYEGQLLEVLRDAIMTFSLGARA